MRAFIATVALLGFCGCAPPSVERVYSGAPPRQAADTMNCHQRMFDSPELQALKSKLPPLEPGSLAGQAQWADPTMATLEEAKLVLSYHQKYVVPCRQDGLVRESKRGPTVVVILVESFAKADANYLALAERKISWGEYNKAVHALRVDTRARLIGVIQEFDPGRENLAYDAEQRQTAKISLDNWKRQQQVLVQKQRLLNPGDPARLNDCTYLGATVTCTTP